MRKLAYNFRFNSEESYFEKEKMFSFFPNLCLIGLWMLTKEIKQQPVWQVTQHNNKSQDVERR